MLGLVINLVATQNYFIYNTINSVLGGEIRKHVSGDPAQYQYYKSDYEDKASTLAAANALNEEIVEEGITLLKNEGGLPLSSGSRISVFGKNSVNLVYGGSGSGGPSSPSMGDLLAGFATGETPVSSYSGISYEGYRDAALIVISRIGGEKIDKDEVEEIGRVMSIYESVVKTGNETLDLILAEKNLLHGDKKIQITCIADGTLLDFMKPTDMYSLFGNALDNAIEAVSTLDESKRTVGLIIKRVQNMISIHIENYYEGEREFANGLPKTQKKDAEYRGYGMLSMRTIAEKYNGTLAVDLTEDVFSLNIMFPSQNRAQNAE